MKIRAFTLVEMLVVMTIVGVLVAMLLPAIGLAKESAVRLTCAAQLRQCAVATVSYAVDYAGNFPQSSFHKRVDLGTSGGLNQAQSDRDTNAIGAFIDDYLQSNMRAFVCPTDVNPTPNKSYKARLANNRTTANENLIENSSYFWIGGAMSFNSWTVRDPRYSSSNTIGNITDPLNTSTVAPGGYLKQSHVDYAKRTTEWVNGAYVTVNGSQPPSKIALFGDYNDNRIGVTMIGHHMLRGVKPQAVAGYINYIQGVNEVLADGHTVWTDYDPSNKNTHWFTGGTRMLMVATDR